MVGGYLLDLYGMLVQYAATIILYCVPVQYVSSHRTMFNISVDMFCIGTNKRPQPPHYPHNTIHLAGPAAAAAAALLLRTGRWVGT